MKFVEVNVGTVAGTIFQTPPNYSFVFDSFYVGNTGSALDTLTLQAQTYDDTGSITGTVTFGTFPQEAGITGNSNYRIPEIAPAGAYITAVSDSGNIVLTYSGKYVYYRE
jgi:hypothetical protein